MSMFLIAISGIVLGYVVPKINEKYYFIIIFFSIFLSKSIAMFFQELFAVYSYWIILPVVIHLVLMECTARHIGNRNKHQ